MMMGGTSGGVPGGTGSGLGGVGDGVGSVGGTGSVGTGSVGGGSGQGSVGAGGLGSDADHCLSTGLMIPPIMLELFVITILLF